MGNTKNAYGKPVYDDVYSEPQDSQDGVDFANEFANVRVGSSSDRQSLAVGKQRAGMLWVETDGEKRIMRTDGAGAWTDVLGGTVVPLSAFSPNWSQTPGYTSFLVAKGKTRFLYGAANRGAGGLLTSLLTIPVDHRPGANLFLPGNVTGGGVAYALGVQSNGIIWVPYGGGSATGTYPLAGQWEVP